MGLAKGLIAYERILGQLILVKSNTSKKYYLLTRRIMLLLTLLLFFVSVSGYAQILVIYPKIREPYRQIFLNIIEGIETNAKDNVYPLEIEQDITKNVFLDALKGQEFNGVVSLGARSLGVLNWVPQNTPIVIGGVIVTPESARYPGITLIPEPATILTNVKSLLPKTKKIYVTYHPKTSKWLLEYAEIAAQELKLELIAKPAEDVRQLALVYREYLKTMDPEEDVLWIALDGASPDRPILQNILEESWRRNLKIISGNLSDVKRGALFAFYPENRAMGVQLVDLLKSIQRKEPNLIALKPVNTLQIAVNLRAADHVHLTFDKKAREKFGLMYPPPSSP